MRSCYWMKWAVFRGEQDEEMSDESPTDQDHRLGDRAD